MSPAQSVWAQIKQIWLRQGQIVNSAGEVLGEEGGGHGEVLGWEEVDPCSGSTCQVAIPIFQPTSYLSSDLLQQTSNSKTSSMTRPIDSQADHEAISYQYIFYLVGDRIDR